MDSLTPYLVFKRKVAEIEDPLTAWEKLQTMSDDADPLVRALALRTLALVKAHETMLADQGGC